MDLADRPLFRAKGGHSWTPVDPRLKGAFICSTSRAPPLDVGKFALQLQFASEAFLRGLSARIVRSTLASAIAIPIYLFTVREWVGLEDMLSEATHQLAWLVAALAAGFVTFVFDSVIALSAKRNDGRWYDAKFVFDQPKLIFSLHVTSDDNNRAFPFKVPGALPGAFVQFEVIVDRSDNRVKADLNLGPGQVFEWDSIGTTRKTGIRLSAKAPVYLMTNATPEATASSVRVFVKSISYDEEPDRRVGVDGWGSP